MGNHRLGRHYDDLATISRMGKVEVGSETRQSLQVVYVDIPCRISQKALPSNRQTESYNEISYETKLFISTDIVILQGDTIEVTRGSTVRKYKAGESFPYPNDHQEVSLQRGDRA